MFIITKPGTIWNPGTETWLNKDVTPTRSAGSWAAVKNGDACSRLMQELLASLLFGRESRLHITILYYDLILRLNARRYKRLQTGVIICKVLGKVFGTRRAEHYQDLLLQAGCVARLFRILNCILISLNNDHEIKRSNKKKGVKSMVRGEERLWTQPVTEERLWTQPVTEAKVS